MLKGATQIQLAKILRTLGNQDAIKILRSAKGGFDGTSDAHRRLGLSIKRYYYRLEKLMETGLVTRKSDRYELTPLGAIVCDSMERRVLWAIENIDRLQVVEALKRSETINEKTLETVTATVLGDKLQSLPRNAEVISTYDRLVETTYELIEGSKEKFYLATRYTDARCVEAGWRALGRGVEMWIVDGDIGLLNGRMKMLRMVISHPTSIKAFYEMWHSKASHIRHQKIPFSFMVVDDSVACFEVLNPTIEGFFAAIRLESKEICHKLERTFHILWEEAGEDPLKDLSEDLMKGVE